MSEEQNENPLLSKLEAVAMELDFDADQWLEIYEIDWESLQGMTEDQAEEKMQKENGKLPTVWEFPAFRSAVLGSGTVELSAHMNFGTQAYESEGKLGDQAPAIWYQRNIQGQGHPGEPGAINRQTPPNQSS